MAQDKTGPTVTQKVVAKLTNGHSSEKTGATATSATPAGMKCNVRNLYEGPSDRRGRSSWTTDYPDDLEEPPENAESAQYALMIRNKKCYDGRKKLEIHSIVVQSPLLKKVLSFVLKDYPGITTSLERLEFQAPFQPFVHRWERLLQARAEATDPETKEHVELLWTVLEEELRETIREKKDLVSNGVTTFDFVWTIFEPGTIVYSDDDSHHRAYRLKNGQYANTQCGRIYAMNCEFVDFDGDRFGFGSTQLAIRAFLGTESITSLSAFPLEYHPEVDAVKKKLISRGRLFEHYAGYHYKHYHGIAWGQGAFGPIKFSINSRVIIDTFAFNRFNPNRKVNLEYLGESSNEEDDEELDYYSDEEISTPGGKQIDQKLTPEQQLLAIPKLRGYSLKDKKWLQFYVDTLKDIQFNGDAFTSLVAPPEQKELILAFAETQAKHKDRFDDVIQGKGKGIIMLLSGPPGVGKTLTAESVAETMQVPLYTMSAGDLGTTPSSVETALSNILEMNTKWNAVLLLDEADVFLEARSTHDLERNKLVSIFLRLLEYYEGILFLTTNRVDNIDAAFESRIHLSLQYDELDQASRRHVWSTFLQRSTNVGKIEDGQLDQLAVAELNGRQIKNVLKTAQLLASKQDSPLVFEHINTVMKLRAANSNGKRAREP